MKDFILYIVYKVFKFLVLIMPKFIVKPFLIFIARTIYFFDKKHVKYAKTNLDIVFADSKTLDEKNEIVKKSYENLVFNSYEFIQSQSMELEDFEEKITLENDEVLKNAISDNRKIILITAHYGNWEYGNSFIPLKYKPTTMVGKRMKNKYVNDELDKTRTKNNTEMLTRKKAGKGLVKALKNDRILGLVIDQHDHQGIDIDFFGKKCKMIDSTSRLAVKFNAVLIPLFFRCDSFGKYTAVFHEGIEPKDYEGENQIFDLTVAQSKAMEKQISQSPEGWFWQHRRWKAYFPEIY